MKSLRSLRLRVILVGSILLVGWVAFFAMLTCKSPTVKQEPTKEENVITITTDCEEVLKDNTKDALDKKSGVKITKKRKKMIPRDYYDYEDNIYVKDYRVNICFAIHSSFGYAEVSCEAVADYIQNEK